MKKKIIAICLCVALVAVGIVGATLAYFTDNDKVVNTFSVGNVDIDLYEYTDYDGDGKLNEEKFQEYLKYSDIMPGDELPKVPVIENVGKNDAYVRVVLTMNQKEEINAAIDTHYEALGYDEEKIQGIFDYVFDGWDLCYTKNNTETVRLWNDRATNDTLLAVDMAACVYANRWCYSPTNVFKTETEETAEGYLYGDKDALVYVDNEDVYYYNVFGGQNYGTEKYNSDNWDSRCWVFYLKLAPGEKYQLFDGLNVPADFTGDQLKMFDNLKIGIYADAIQTANFTETTDEESGETTAAWVNAFNALEAAHPLGWWY